MSGGAFGGPGAERRATDPDGHPEGSAPREGDPAGARARRPLEVVLLEPEIPQNAGNVARTCACAGVCLHLVRPFGFVLDERRLARAAMDYWEAADVQVHASAEAFLSFAEGSRVLLFTGSAPRTLAETEVPEGSFLVFGRESRGIDPELLQARPQDTVRLPMAPGMRSLNVSNAAAIAVYSVLGRWGFPGLV